ncbi:CRISPR-associated protein Cas4 [Candidatus Pacearchaeota archaeon]|nr:CRISPR-associated protein Cas4 [Candidatus Pacearchaeota archaeon]
MKIINITDITEYLYCPRKVYLKLVKGIKAPPSQRMINGMLRHKVFDIFNKNEKALVSSIKEKMSSSEIKKLYDNLISNITQETILLNKNLITKFNIDNKEFSISIKKTTEPEINLRISAITNTINSGFFGAELWRNLKPKYLTEYKIESFELGLRGRIDRIKFEDGILPIERKSREKIFESDKIQLAGYALLLEKEFSRKVEKGIIEIMGKEEQVEITEELKSRVLEIAEKIRNLVEQNAFTPSSFQKCENCEFKQDCDE